MKRVHVAEGYVTTCTDHLKELFAAENPIDYGSPLLLEIGSLTIAKANLEDADVDLRRVLARFDLRQGEKSDD
jgi:hypothetical protein